jgi:MoaA/NifB/PqqE/SkfB family radical SAM enzyme
MSYITVDNLNIINAEMTNWCNAACPRCARFTWNELKLRKDRVNSVHTSLELIKNGLGPKIISQLTMFGSCGTYGDMSMNPETVQIYEYVKKHNKNCLISPNTNGGARNKEFWRSLAKIGVRVSFAIDGLEDTNHLYRRNVNWDKLMENVQAFISAGGKAEWGMLIFKHNQHQIEEAKALSKKLGFKIFNQRYSNRWSADSDIRRPDGRMAIRVDDYFVEEPEGAPSTVYGADDPATAPFGKKDAKTHRRKPETFNYKSEIICMAHDQGRHEIYLRANGQVQPCCMLGDIDKHEAKVLIDDYDKVNLNKTSLEEILNGPFFKVLQEGIYGGTDKRLHTCFNTCRKSLKSGEDFIDIKNW